MLIHNNSPLRLFILEDKDPKKMKSNHTAVPRSYTARRPSSIQEQKIKVRVMRNITN